jgi:hypothetical protein
MAEDMTVIPCPPYSSGVCDFFLFQKLKFKNNYRLNFPTLKHRASAGSSSNGSVAGHAA